MNSTLHNPFTAREDLAQRVTAEANRRGVPTNDLMNQIVEAGLSSLSVSPLPAGVRTRTPQEKAESFLRWASTQNLDAPALLPESVTREAIYADDRDASFFDDRKAA